MHAMEGTATPTLPSGAQQNFWGRNGDQICVNIITGAVLAGIGFVMQTWLTPNDPSSKDNALILQRDTTIANTSKQLDELHKLASTTNNPFLAQECRKQIETGEKLLAQAIALRNQALAKLSTEQVNHFESKPTTTLQTSLASNNTKPSAAAA